MLGATLSKEEVDEFMKEADIVSICIVDILKLLYNSKELSTVGFFMCRFRSLYLITV